MPLRRIEILLSQIALCVVRGPLQGSENMRLEDFGLSRAEESAEEFDGADLVGSARGAFGYAPQKDNK